jgi:hypothetical protein
MLPVAFPLTALLAMDIIGDGRIADGPIPPVA